MADMGKINEVRDANAAFIKMISKINPQAKIWLIMMIELGEYGLIMLMIVLEFLQ